MGEWLEWVKGAGFVFVILVALNSYMVAAFISRAFGRPASGARVIYYTNPSNGAVYQCVPYEQHDEPRVVVIGIRG